MPPKLRLMSTLRQLAAGEMWWSCVS